MVDLKKIQKEHAAWVNYNFPETPVHQTMFGIMEEVGELSHALLKQEQNIRGDTALHEAEAQDAIGDILIYIMHLCTLKGWNMTNILSETWDQVKSRDWIKFPKNGVSI